MSDTLSQIDMERLEVVLPDAVTRGPQGQLVAMWTPAEVRAALSRWPSLLETPPPTPAGASPDEALLRARYPRSGSMFDSR